MPHFSYLVTQPHDTTRWADGDETTWNESLHASLFGCLGERDLVLLFGRTNTADNHINTSQRLDELLLWGLQVAFPNLAAPILKARYSWLLGRDRANKSDNLLFIRKTKAISLESIGKAGSWTTYKVPGIQQSVGDRTSGFTRCSDEQNLGGHNNFFKLIKMEDGLGLK